jgi:hypothetical protein
LIFALAAQSGAQTRPAAGRAQSPAAASAQTTTAARVAVPLPASDAVLTVDLKRLLTEAMPRALAGDAARLAQVNADIEQFKTRTGIDARAFDTLAVGARIVKLASGATKIDNVVAIARGTFKADALIASARAASKGAMTEQSYGGKTVYVTAINDRIKVFGLAKMHVSDLALAVLDANTLAVGDPDGVRGSIDAMAGRGRVDQTLLSSVQASPDIIAFAGNVPPGAFANADTGLPNVDRAIASIRSFYGSFGTTPAGYQMTTVLRTGTAADANQLYKTADALKQIAPGFISMAGERWKFANGLVNNLKLTTKGSEVQLRLDVPQSDMASILRAL